MPRTGHLFCNPAPLSPLQSGFRSFWMRGEDVAPTHTKPEFACSRAMGFRASIDDGPNVKLKPDYVARRALCWRSPHPVICPPSSVQLKRVFESADHCGADRKFDRAGAAQQRAEAR